MTLPHFARPLLSGPLFPEAAGSWKSFWRSREAGAIVARVFSIEQRGRDSAKSAVLP